MHARVYAYAYVYMHMHMYIILVKKKKRTKILLNSNIILNKQKKIQITMPSRPTPQAPPPVVCCLPHARNSTQPRNLRTRRICQIQSMLMKTTENFYILRISYMKIQLTPFNSDVQGDKQNSSSEQRFELFGLNYKEG